MRLCKDCKWNREAKVPGLLPWHFCSHPSVFDENTPLTINTDREFTECEHYQKRKKVIHSQKNI